MSDYQDYKKATQNAPAANTFSLGYVQDLILAADNEIQFKEECSQRWRHCAETKIRELYHSQEEIQRLREDRDSWRRVAERLEREKQALKEATE